MMFWRLATASLYNRKGSALLTILAISVSVFVLLGVEQIRHQAKHSFSNTVSGIDLIVGGRTGDINLLLYSVFRIGNATNNISWASYQEIAADPKIAWTIPISLGDSHKGYRVMGTTDDYFRHFRFGKNQKLTFSQGKPFNNVLDVVLGAEVARTLGYKIGDKLVLAHGLGSTSFSKHDDNPFYVTGILKTTGTPVDQTLHVQLEGISAIHVGWQNGVKIPGLEHSAYQQPAPDLTPESITAFMIGLQSKMSTFRLQRQINNYTAEPLVAILPGVTLTQLWQMLSVMESTLRLIAALVLVASLLGLAAMLLASIRERQREMAVMRAIGASPWFILLLIEAESLLITLFATGLAVLLLTVSSLALHSYLAEQFSLFLDGNLITTQVIIYLTLIVVSSLIIGLIPGIAAYRNALQQQLSVS